MPLMCVCGRLFPEVTKKHVLERDPVSLSMRPHTIQPDLRPLAAKHHLALDDSPQYFRNSRREYRGLFFKPSGV